MGSYRSWKLTADCDVGGEQFIISTANSILKESGDNSKIEQFIWNRWSEETKWWAPEFVQKLSQNLDIIFKLEARGDDNFTWFFHKGNILSEDEVWERPPFPSRPLFKKRFEIAKVKRAETKRLQEEQSAKAEKQRLQNEIATLKAKQEELQKKLAG
jgi:hypothetical protein